MKQYVIHTEDGLYLPTTNWGSWRKDFKYAKKYKNKPAMFRRLIQMMEQSPKENFYFETLEVKFESKGSQTLGAYNRIKKVKRITKNINGPF